MSKPGLPQGTRDFGSQTVYKRNFIFETIRSVFELYGYEPLETPAMENLDTLLGKYGEEGDKLIFKISAAGIFRRKRLTSPLRESFPETVPPNNACRSERRGGTSGRLLRQRKRRMTPSIP